MLQVSVLVCLLHLQKKLNIDELKIVFSEISRKKSPVRCALNLHTASNVSSKSYSYVNSNDPTTEVFLEPYQKSFIDLSPKIVNC